MLSRPIDVLTLTAAAILLSVVSVAAADGIDPRCAKMRDKLGCTCALQNGGGLSGNGWWSRRSHAPVNDRFVACLIKHGRR